MAIKPINAKKIQLGAGTEQIEGYFNTDIVDLPGLDLVLNVMNFPWPFEDNSADEILAFDLIEHLPTHTNTYENTLIKFLEEAHRILKPNGLLHMRTPGWRSDFCWIDFTHVRPFDIRSFDFLDSSKDFGRSTGFYSKCKFKVDAEEFENHNLDFKLIKI